MAVYVDKLKHYPIEMVEASAKRWGTRWCHCWADTPEELLLFCHKAGWPESWIQKRGKPGMHIDLVISKREMALRLGAVEMSFRDWYVEHVIKPRREA
jgi:hypothetical protein